MVKSFASYELCMAFLRRTNRVCVYVVPKVDKFSCADNHADFKASNINVYLIPPLPAHLLSFAAAQNYAY